jgi:hypothetical protein
MRFFLFLELFLELGVGLLKITVSDPGLRDYVHDVV